MKIFKINEIFEVKFNMSWSLFWLPIKDLYCLKGTNAMMKWASQERMEYEF